MSTLRLWATCQVDGRLIRWHIWDHQKILPDIRQQFPPLCVTADRPIEIECGIDSAVTAVVQGADGYGYLILFNRGLAPASPPIKKPHVHAAGGERCADCCDNLCQACQCREAVSDSQFCRFCVCSHPNCRLRRIPDSDFCGEHQG